jgi:multidrug efflux pump subunit AcrB
MNSLTHFAITNARFTWLIVAVVCLAGTSVYFTQPRQEDPEVTLRSAQVVTQVPGLSPERIEQLVTRPIEDAVKSISEVDEIKSLSMTGLSIVMPEAASRYTDMAPIWADLRNKMDDLAPRLPEGAVGPQVNDDFGRVAVITLALTGSEYTMAELYSVARDIQKTLSALPLVARVDLFGVQPEHIWIEIDAAFMAQFGISGGASRAEHCAAGGHGRGAGPEHRHRALRRLPLGR